MSSNYVDIFFEAGVSKFVLEIKVKAKKDLDELPKGIVQAYEYCINFKTTNLIVIVLPPTVVRDISDIAEFSDRVLKSRVESIVLTQYWFTYETNHSIEEILGELKAKVDKQVSAVMQEQIASTVIQKTVKNISRLLNKLYTNQLSVQNAAKELTEGYGLGDFFSNSSFSVDKKKTRNMVIDLIAYILVNQLLFYSLYSESGGPSDSNRRVPKLEKISHPRDLERYFLEIRKKDFNPIFGIQTIKHIPYSEQIVNEINILLECVAPLRVINLKHDLYGKLFENSLPKDTRKVLASYFTKYSSAQLVANLTIDNAFDTVWDLACGSGSLLVASYDRKLDLYKSEKGILSSVDRRRLHSKFVKEQLTGTDIMPFACHLTGIGLSTKDLDSDTDFLRISRVNMVEVESLQKHPKFVEAYTEIEEGTSKIQKKQKEIDDWQSVVDFQYGSRKEFNQERVDRVVINPPFTSFRRLSEDIRAKLKNSPLGKISGNRNLWGYFISLADDVLKNGGKIGAIVPISLLHGHDTLKLRNFLLENYTVRYIIKPVVGYAFSEDAQFTDVIVIAEKVIPDKSHKVRIVCLKKDIGNFSKVDIDSLCRDIRTESDDSESEYFSYTVDQLELARNSNDLMPYVFTNDIKLKKASDKLMIALRKNPNFVKVDLSKISDGLALRSKGLVNRSIFTRKLGESRASRASLVFFHDGNQGKMLNYFDKVNKKKGTIEKSLLQKTLRTLSGIDKITIAGLEDYFKKGIHKSPRVGQLFIENRFWLKSTELSFLAVYSAEPLFPLNMFMTYNTSESESKILALYFNSIFFILQIIRLAKQSTRGYLEIKQVDMTDVLIPDTDNIGEETKELLAFFASHAAEHVDSLYEQLSKMSKFRLELDMRIAKSLNLEISRDDILELYELVSGHIKSLP
jgi:type I restriction-modification system DNA methylase subunit